MKSRFNHTGFGNSGGQDNQNNSDQFSENDFFNQDKQPNPNQEQPSYKQGGGLGGFFNSAKAKINEMKNRPGDLSETDGAEEYEQYNNQAQPNQVPPNLADNKTGYNQKGSSQQGYGEPKPNPNQAPREPGYNGTEYNNPSFEKKYANKKVGVIEKLVVVALVGCGVWFGYHHFMNSKGSSSTDSNSAQTTKTTTSTANSANKYQYKYPSERGTDYPSPYAVSALDVSLKDQKIYVMNGKKIIYTILMSSGKNGTTPTGDFAIQAQQGKKYWNEQYKTGMNYWSSYKGDGQYRISTIPTDKDGKEITPDENYLGVKPTTINGNIVVSTPDAKFIYNLVLGTPIHIYNH